MMRPYLLLSLVFSLTGSMNDEREDIKVPEVPDVVRAACGKVAPKVPWTKAARERAGDRTIYELSGKNAGGRNVAVVALDDGKVTEVFTQVTWGEVPGAARDSLQARLPRFRAGEIRRCVSHVEIRMVYVFEGTLDGKHATVNIEPDGSHFQAEFETAPAP